MSMNVYLAGYIQGSVIKECVAWRKKIRETYDTWPNGRYPINWLDPLNGENFNEISPDGLKGVFPPNAIVHKDYNSVRISDLLIVNTDTFGQNRPLMGTLFELAWAYDWRKPVIMITNDIIWEQHPFITNTVSWYVKSVEELLEKKIINEFYKAFHSAQY